MKIRPLHGKENMASGIHVIQGKVYDAMWASGIPFCREQKMVLVVNAEGDKAGKGIVLTKSEYEIVQED